MVAMTKPVTLKAWKVLNSDLPFLVTLVKVRDGDNRAPQRAKSYVPA